jgi:N-acetyl-gamma-glutamyl-phosphate reductase
MALEVYTGRAPVHLTFTPHLVPMLRGIHATITVPVSEGVTANDLRGVLADFGDGKPFYQVVAGPPQTRWAVGSNRAIVSVYLDEPTGNAVILSVIDNLLKGAAGQAVQAANLMLGFDEAAGLPTSGWMP